MSGFARAAIRACATFVCLTGATSGPCILAAIALMETANAAEIPVTTPMTLEVVQQVQTSSAGLGVSLTARLGRVAASGPSGLVSSVIAARDIPPRSLGLQGVPVADYGTARLDIATMQAQSDAMLLRQWPTLDQELDAAMRQCGADSAVFTLLQQVEPAGGTGSVVPATLTWSSYHLAGQAGNHSATRLHPDQASLLLITYVPRGVAGDLPSGLGYADAGTLRWVQTDAALQPVGPAQRLDVAGAFDNPTSPAASNVDPDAGLRCLVDHRNAGCAVSLPDVRGLLARYGATVALLDYRRQLTALRQAQTQPDGSTAWVVQLDTSISRRTLQGTLPLPACPGTTLVYGNSGTRGYVVQAVSDRYFVGLSDTAPYRWLGSVRDTEPVQAEPYSKQVSVTPSQIPLLDALVIDPVGDQLDLIPASQVPGLIQIVPIDDTVLTPPQGRGPGLGSGRFDPLSTPGC